MIKIGEGLEEIALTLKEIPTYEPVTHAINYRECTDEILEALNMISIQDHQFITDYLESCQINGCTQNANGRHILPHRDLEDIRTHKQQPLCPRCTPVNLALDRIKKMGLGEYVLNRSLHTYDISEDPSISQAIQAALKGQGLYLHGEPGNGKTHLLCAIGRRLCWLGKRVRYYSHEAFIKRVKSSFNDPLIKNPLDSWINKVDVILIDEMCNLRPTEWSRDTSSEMIMELHREHIQLIAASNISPSNLNKAMDSRAISRLGDLLPNVHQCTGRDRRGNGFNPFKGAN